MDMNQYLDIFIDETKEHLQNLNEQILILEKEPENEATINEIFRAAHSLKGMAGTMGYKRMQRLTHDMENVFSEIRNGKMKATDELVDVLFRGLDALESYLANIQSAADEGTEDNDDIIAALNEFLNGGGAVKEVKEVTEAAAEVAVTEAAVITENNAKFKELKLEEFEQHAVIEAYNEGDHVFGMTVFVQETCILKSARAFLVFKALEEAGTIIKSQPGVQDIEDEKFDFDFSLFFITKLSLEDVKAKVLNVSEIKDVIIELIEKPEVAPVQEKQEQDQEKPEEKKAKAAKKEQKTQASKPVVNRSVRVDIEKLDVLMNLVSELIIAKNGLVSINSTDRNDKTQGSFNEQIEYLERVTTSLHESVMKVRMVPIESVVNRFPRMIRDLSKKLNK
ncbi:MAG: Hpt domain-containing protein, partial [bacterium]|nr:Hpt domain-containing protein [bacterium]